MATTIMYLRTGHAYQLQAGLTLDAVNASLTANAGKFFQVPLDDDQPLVAGNPERGDHIQALFITPDAVSHFIVV